MARCQVGAFEAFFRYTPVSSLSYLKKHAQGTHTNGRQDSTAHPGWQRDNRYFMEIAPLPEPASMPIFILFDTQTGYLYGHLFATGPEDPFLQEVIQWWSRYCSNAPIGVDYPGLTQQSQTAGNISSN